MRTCDVFCVGGAKLNQFTAYQTMNLALFPVELLKKIAFDSYRTWQLLRLTCKNAYNMGEYNILRPFATYTQTALSRALFIDIMFSMITIDAFNDYCVNVVNKKVLRIVKSRPCGFSVITPIIFYDNKYNIICKITKERRDRTLTGGDTIRIMNIECWIQEGAGYVGQSRQYIKEIMPELHRKIEEIGSSIS